MVLAARVSGAVDTRDRSVETERLRVLGEEKARAELADADALVLQPVRWSGSVTAEVMLVKGFPGPAEDAGGDAMTGPDGAAADAALDRLGWGTSSVFRTVSRPLSAANDDAVAARLHLQVEAVDPRFVIALDREAAADLERAFGLRRMRFGVEQRSLGRRFLAVDGLEASLADETRKRTVWAQMRSAEPDGPVF